MGTSADITQKTETMSNEIRVFETDSIEETARKIFEDFAIHQSCTVKGLEWNGEQRVICKGEEVIKEIERLDRKYNMQKQGKKLVRKRKRLPNTIGDFVAHKTFKYQKVTVDNDIRYQIWRIQ